MRFLLVIIYLFLNSALCFADDAANLSAVANNFLQPANMLTELAYKACYIIGFALVVGSGLQYKLHRDNPMQVRLSQVLFILVFGLILIAIPIIAQLSVASHVFNAD